MWTSDTGESYKKFSIFSKRPFCRYQLNYHTFCCTIHVFSKTHSKWCRNYAGKNKSEWERARREGGGGSMGFNWSHQHFSFTLVIPGCCSLHLEPSVQRPLFILYPGSSPHDCSADAVISFLWKLQLATSLLERIASMCHPLGRLVKGAGSYSSSSSIRNGWSRPALWVIRLWQTASASAPILHRYLHDLRVGYFLRRPKEPNPISCFGSLTRRDADVCWITLWCRYLDLRRGNFHRSQDNSKTSWPSDVLCNKIVLFCYGWF